MSNTQLMTNLMGEVCWTEMFRPVESNNTLTDGYGNVWKQITALGWNRECDDFFWPANPTNINNHMGTLPHTVAQVIAMRNKQNN